MPLAFFRHDDCVRHDMGRGHPEAPARLVAIERWIATHAPRLEVREAPAVDAAALSRAHAPPYVDAMLALLADLAERGAERPLDGDTLAGPFTGAAALRAAGAAVAATDAVLDGTATRAFCAVRPPGHHAMRSRAMGFCVFNNVAVAARHALEVRGLERVAIVDFDVHHGNGTEDIVAGDERVLMLGFFQHPFYPGSGVPARAGNIDCTPLAAGSGGAAVRRLVESDWLPRLDAFAPQLVFLSAGFDAHRDDPLGGMALTEDDYGWITARLCEAALRHAEGRVVSCLEGGYDLDALARSVGAHLQALAA